MKQLITALQYEYKHLVRSPFKVISIVLFVIAAVYGLYNGTYLFKKQTVQVETIQLKDNKKVDDAIKWYNDLQKEPDIKLPVDITSPTRAVAYIPGSALKTPSPLMPFSIGQAEQFGYYKNVTTRSAVFDADLAEEIANPERLMTGTLDFSFVLLYLIPVLAIILLFNIGGLEYDLGFDKLIKTNRLSYSQWLIGKFSFYFFLLAGLLLVLMLISATLTGALSVQLKTFIQLYLLLVLYIVLWFTTFFFINRFGKGSSDQAIKMVSVWLLFCVILPGTVHQVALLKYPTGYMTEFLDAAREDAYKLYDLSADEVKAQILKIYPELSETAMAKDPEPDPSVKSFTVALSNQLMKDAANIVEQNNEKKNRFILSTSWLNPVTGFQNKVNALCDTDYYAYQRYRKNIQVIIDKKIEMLLKNAWNKRIINKEIFMEYVEAFQAGGQ